MLGPAVLAVAVLLPGLGRQPLWLDEVASAQVAGGGYPALGRLLRHTDAVLGAYYLFLHLWLRLGIWLEAGTGGLAAATWWLRLPSALAGVAAVAFTALVGTRLGGRWVGAGAGCLLAVHPFATMHAQDGRPYTLVVALVVAGSWLLLLDLDLPRWWTRAGWALAVALAGWGHLLSLLVLVAQLAALAWRRPQALRRLLPAAGVAVAAVTPLALVAAGQSAEVGFLRPPTPRTLAGLVGRLVGPPALSGAYALVAVAALCCWWRRRRQRGSGPGPELAVAVPLLWLLLPPVVLTAVSLAHPLLLPRYLLVCVPALCLLAALALARLPSRAAAVGAGVALVAVSAGVSDRSQDRPYRYEDLAAGARYVLADARPGDAVLYTPDYARLGLPYDLAVLGRGRVQPVDVTLAPGGSPDATGTFTGTDLPPAGQAQAVRAATRVFLVWYADTPPSVADPAVLALLAADRPVVERRFGELVIAVWQPAGQTGRPDQRAAAAGPAGRQPG